MCEEFRIANLSDLSAGLRFTTRRIEVKLILDSAFLIRLLEQKA